MTAAEVRQAKADLRARLLAARRRRSPVEIEAAAAALARHGGQICAGAGTVTAYVALPGEPPTEPLLESLRATGVRVLLPVIDGDRLDWAVDTGERRRGPLGIAQPVGPRLGETAIEQAEVVLVPALAVDRHGCRLGRGSGYYDRTLPARSSRSLTVAVVYDDELVEGELPAEGHDVAMDAALSPAGVWRLR